MFCLLPLQASPGVSAFSKTLPEFHGQPPTHPSPGHKWSLLHLHPGSPCCPCRQGNHRGPCPLRGRLLGIPSMGAASCRIHGGPPWCPLFPKQETSLLCPMSESPSGKRGGLQDNATCKKGSLLLTRVRAPAASNAVVRGQRAPSPSCYTNL